MRHNRSNTSVIAVLVVASLLALTGCGILQSLQLIVDATAAAVPILQAEGVNVPPQAAAYIGDVAACIGNTFGNPSPAQLLVIATCLGEKVKPTLPPGAAQALISIIDLVANDVAAYLTHPPVGMTPNAPALGSVDVNRMLKLRATAQDTAAACRKLAKK